MSKYDIAAYIWPAYTGKEIRTRQFWEQGIGEWQTVKNPTFKPEWNFNNPQPLWGYVDEADKNVMEMQIEKASEHGVNVFIYDWYWYDGRPFLEQCLNDGYLQAENNDKPVLIPQTEQRHPLHLSVMYRDIIGTLRNGHPRLTARQVSMKLQRIFGITVKTRLYMSFKNPP